MICPTCGALGPDDAATCRNCGAGLASGAQGNAADAPFEPDEIEVVLRPRSDVPAGASSANAPAEPTLPTLAPKRPALVIDVDDAPAGLPAPLPLWDAPATSDHEIIPVPQWAPPGVPAAPQPWTPLETLPAPVPPGGGPPALPEAPPEPGEPSRWRSPLTLGALSALLLVIAAGCGWYFLTRGSADERLAGSTLQAGQTRVTEFAGRASRTTKLVSWQALGRASTTAASELDARERSAGQIGDDELRTQTVTLIAAQRGYLSSLGALSRVGMVDLRRDGTPQWALARSRLQASAVKLRESQSAIAAQHLPGDTTIELASVSASVKALDGRIRSAAWAIKEYRRKLAAYNRRLAAAKAKAAAIAGYRQRVLAVLTSYDQDRDAVGDFVDRLDQYDWTKSADYQDAATTAAGFRNDRVTTVGDLREITPPTGATEEHSALTEPVERSRDALLQLGQAIDDAWTSEDPVSTQPTWNAFQATSDEVDAQNQSVRQEWENRVEALRQAALTDGVGTQPKPPSI